MWRKVKLATLALQVRSLAAVAVSIGARPLEDETPSSPSTVRELRADLGVEYGRVDRLSVLLFLLVRVSAFAVVVAGCSVIKEASETGGGS